MISSGEVNAKDHELDMMLGVVSDAAAPLYTRGLAVAAVGSYLTKTDNTAAVREVSVQYVDVALTPCASLQNRSKIWCSWIRLSI